MEITDFRADYHRNGVGGEGSYVCFFRATFDGHDRLPMMAVLWGDNPGEHGDGFHPTEAMVMRLSEVGSVAVAYLDGNTPETIGDHLGADIEMGAYRSTDNILPHLVPLLRPAIEERWAVQRAYLAREAEARA